MLRFISALILYSITLLSLTWFGAQQLWFKYPSYYLEITLFIAIITLVSYRRLVAIASPEQFVQGYLLSITIHLILYLGFITAVLYLDRGGLVENAVYFLINCLIFIGLQVGFLFFRKSQ